MGFFIRTHEMETLLVNFQTIGAVKDSLKLQLDTLAAESEDEVILSMALNHKIDGQPVAIGSYTDKTCCSALKLKSKDVDNSIKEIYRELILIEKVSSQIEIALRILRPRERDIITFKYFQNMTWQQVADEILFSLAHTRRLGNEALSKLTVASKISLDDYNRLRKLLLNLN